MTILTDPPERGPGVTPSTALEGGLQERERRRPNAVGGEASLGGCGETGVRWGAAADAQRSRATPQCTRVRGWERRF